MNRTTTADQSVEPKPQIVDPNNYNQTVWIIPLGIAAFVISAFLLIGSPNTKKKFYEIGIDFKKIELAAMDSIRFRVQQKLIEAQTQKTIMVKANLHDTATLNEKIDSITNALHAVEIRSYELAYKNQDTLSLSTNYSINKKILHDSINKFKKGASVPLQFGYYDSELSKEPVIVEGKLETNYFDTSFDFFSQYPNFAMWGFVWILQMVVWFIIIGICLSLFKKVRNLFVGKDGQSTYGLTADYSRIAFKRSVWLSVIPVLLFSIIFYFIIIDKIFLTDDFFTTGFLWKSWTYSLIGYVASAMCFIGYLYISYLIDQIQTKFNDQVVHKRDLEREKSKYIDDQQKQEVAELNKKMAVIDDEITTMKQGYSLAKKYFNLFLIMTAVVLCLSVLFAAALFNSVNSMAVFKYYTLMGGGSYLSQDFVYLFGALNSILLLIYFLPVKFNLFNLNMAIPELDPPGDNTVKGNVKQAATSFGKVLGEILIISSPLLASLVQNFLDWLGK